MVNIITEFGVQFGLAILEAIGDVSDWASQAGFCVILSLLLVCLLPVWLAAILAGSYFLCFRGLVSRGILYSLRWWLANPMYYYARFFFGYTSQSATDGHKCMHGLTIVRDIRYSSSSSYELMDVLEPVDLPRRGNILYIHGGGFSVVHRELMLQSVTVFARNGFRVFAMDYPLAPEAMHPVPVESVLSAMAFIRSEYDVTDLVVIGDSAGGCLATNAVASISNPFAFSFRLYKTPRIDKLVLLYPILDNASWRPHRWTESGIESWKLFVQRRIADLLSLSIKLYKQNPSDVVTICEQIDLGMVSDFVPTLVVCGELDPLKRSVARFKKSMTRKLPHVRVETVKELPLMIHGFHGAPRWMVWPEWRNNIVVVNRSILSFISGTEVEHEVPANCRDRVDYCLLLFICAKTFFCLQIYMNLSRMWQQIPLHFFSLTAS